MSTFSVEQIEYAYQTSGEKTGDRSPAARVRTGIQSARVRCSCGYGWQGAPSTRRGPLYAELGGYHFVCPECHAENPVPLE